MLPDDDGRQPIPTGHVNDSGDCKKSQITPNIDTTLYRKNCITTHFTVFS